MDFAHHALKPEWAITHRHTANREPRTANCERRTV